MRQPKNFLLIFFALCGILLFSFSTISNNVQPVSANAIQLADDDYDYDDDHNYKDGYKDDYGKNNQLEEILKTSGEVLQYFFILALAFVVPVQLMKSKLLEQQQKKSVGKVYKWLWKIHIPVAIIGLVGITLHGILAFLYEFRLSDDHITGLITGVILLTVIGSGIFRKKRKYIWAHLILSAAFVVAFLIHG